MVSHGFDIREFERIVFRGVYRDIRYKEAIDSLVQWLLTIFQTTPSRSLLDFSIIRTLEREKYDATNGDQAGSACRAVKENWSAENFHRRTSNQVSCLASSSKEISSAEHARPANRPAIYIYALHPA